MIRWRITVIDRCVIFGLLVRAAVEGMLASHQLDAIV